jgi:hypothetical protein
MARFLLRIILIKDHATQVNNNTGLMNKNELLSGEHWLAGQHSMRMVVWTTLVVRATITSNIFWLLHGFKLVANML